MHPDLEQGGLVGEAADAAREAPRMETRHGQIDLSSKAKKASRPEHRTAQSGNEAIVLTVKEAVMVPKKIFHVRCGGQYEATSSSANSRPPIGA